METPRTQEPDAAELLDGCSPWDIVAGVLGADLGRHYFQDVHCHPRGDRYTFPVPVFRAEGSDVFGCVPPLPAAWELL